MNKKRQTLLYIICDYVSAIIVWTLFFFLRNEYIDAYYLEFPEQRALILSDEHYVYGLCFIPLMWLLLYYLSGYYKNVYRKSRLKELINTFFITLVGSFILLFAIILDDNVPSYEAYYESYILLVCLHFIVTYIPRFIITTRTTKKSEIEKLVSTRYWWEATKKRSNCTTVLFRQKNRLETNSSVLSMLLNSSNIKWQNTFHIWAILKT